MISTFLLCVLVTTATPAFSSPRARELHKELVRSVRAAVDPHGHGGEGTTCAVTSASLAHEFTELAEEMMFMGCDGEEICHVEEEDEHSHDDEESLHNETEVEGHCKQTFHFVEQLMLRLNLTTPCCLGEGNKTCEEEKMSSSTRPSAANAYGYGFLLVSMVSLGSLLGLFMLPFTKNPRLKQYYQYIYALLIALGASALFCDAILHLIPEAFGLHAHEEEGDEHAEEEGAEELTIIWRSCVVILGLYLFFVFEFVLHTWSVHSHSLSSSRSNSKSDLVNLELTTGKSPSKNEDGDKCPKDCKVTDATFPHGSCSAGDEGIISGIIHSTAEEGLGNGDTTKHNKSSCWSRWAILRYISSIKPLAWLIIVGDALHNFADGLALGAAISQSLSLGISTAIALVFHEIPHELGDYVILLSTGMTWYAALFFNFISALTAIIGFFVGVGIGTASEEANAWILAAAAGVFLYIALVDLLPELIHTKEQGLRRFILFIMINIGLVISFVALLVLAIYEEDLERLVRF